MVDRRRLTHETAASVKVSRIQSRIKLDFLQAQLSRQAFEVIQESPADTSLHKIRMHKDRADFAVLQVKHSCRHRLSINTAQIEVLLHNLRMFRHAFEYPELLRTECLTLQHYSI